MTHKFFMLRAVLFVLCVSAIFFCSFGAIPSAWAQASWPGTHTVQVVDPANKMTAFTVEVPSNWKFVGTILRPGGCHAPEVPADGLSLSAVAPDNVTAVMQLPGVQWDWASDGSSPQGKRCGPVSISTAAGFLLNIAAPNMHPSAKILGVVPNTPQMEQNLENQRRTLAQQANRMMHMTVDTARIRIEYNLNGQTVQEQLGTIINCRVIDTPAYPAMHRPAITKRICASHGIYVRRALQGHLDELIAKAQSLPAPRIDRQWDDHISEQMRKAFAAYQHASDEQFKAIQDHFTQQTAAMLARGKAFNDNLVAQGEHARAQDNATVNAMNHAAHLQVLDSLNRQDFMDPTTGKKIETSNQYEHNWISSDKSEVVLNKDATFDPNGVIDPVRQSWTELIPIN